MAFKGAIIACVVSALLAALYAPINSNTLFITRTDDGEYQQAKKLLLVTAHPDDEAMFFAPTILTLAGRQDINLFHVCLSNGNADGLGDARRIELARSLDILGISRQNRWLIDHPELQDNFTAHWHPEVIAKTLQPYVSRLDIDTVLTFDSHGISSHPNHMAIPEGVKFLIRDLNATLPTVPRLFSLVSTSLLTKYISWTSKAVESLPNHLFRPEPDANPIFFSGYAAYMTAFMAMMAHSSQLVWFRWLYIVYSRYMWTNSWEAVTVFGD